MIPLERALMNLGDRIVELIGKDQYGALKALGRDTLDQDSLVRLCISIHTEVGLLRNIQSRNIIFNSLTLDNARELAMVLGFSYEKTPYSKLVKRTFRKNSKPEEHLFGFFGVSIPEEDEHEDEKETSQLVMARYGLFPHQRDALVGIEQILNHEGGRAVLHMPTGSGKTRTAMNLASKHLNRDCLLYTSPSPRDS